MARSVGILVLALTLPLTRNFLDSHLLEFSDESLIKSGINFAGKNVVITGANSGIGLSLATTATALGANVIMACRSLERCSSARMSIAEKNYDVNNVNVLQLDLSDIESIKRFTGSVEFGQVDYLFNNAGFAVKPSTGVTHTIQQHLEVGLGSMHFGHFYLTMDLIESGKIKEGSSRVIMTSSAAGQFEWATGGRFHKSILAGDGEGDLKGEITAVSSFNFYGRAKLANTLFSRELYERHRVEGCSAHVGAVATNIWAFGGGVQVLVDAYVRMTMRSIEEGSRVLWKCALSDDKIVVGGAYMDAGGGVRGESLLSGPSVDDELQKALWSVSEKYYGDYKK